MAAVRRGCRLQRQVLTHTPPLCSHTTPCHPPPPDPRHVIFPQAYFLILTYVCCGGLHPLLSLSCHATHGTLLLA